MRDEATIEEHEAPIATNGPVFGIEGTGDDGLATMIEVDLAKPSHVSMSLTTCESTQPRTSGRVG